MKNTLEIIKKYIGHLIVIWTGDILPPPCKACRRFDKQCPFCKEMNEKEVVRVIAPIRQRSKVEPNAWYAFFKSGF